MKKKLKSPLDYVMRCKKLGGRLVPKSCHVLNGRKDSCEDLIMTDEKETIKLFEL